MKKNRKLLAGNWKMNTTVAEGKVLAKGILNFIENNPLELPLLIFPPATHLSELSKMSHTSEHLYLGAQNAHNEDNGAYTGEISVPMLKELEVKYLLVGHSERRAYFQESDRFLLSKLKKALEHKLKVVFCFGEALEIREANNYKSFVQDQIEQVLFHLDSSEMESVVLAYEPVWAIGTGKNASPEQAQEVHAFVRELLSDKFGQKCAEHTTILYGGSCKPSNAEALFSQKDVDGGLIGGASLKAEDFIQLYKQLNAN